MSARPFSFSGSEADHSPPEPAAGTSNIENPYVHSAEYGTSISSHADTGEPEHPASISPSHGPHTKSEYGDAESHVSVAASQKSRRSLRNLLTRQSTRGSTVSKKSKQEQRAEEEAEERRKAEDPEHILDTIMEDNEEDELSAMNVQEAVANLTADAPGSSPEMDETRQNLARQRRLRKSVAGSSVVKSMRKIYTNFLARTLITRWFLYWLPLAILLFIPLAVGAWENIDLKLGGSRLMWIFIWLEVAWAALAVGRVISHYIPSIASFLISIFAPRYYRYIDMILAMEIPMTLVIWTFVAFITFVPLLSDNHDSYSNSEVKSMPRWQQVINDILVAFFISAMVYFVEQIFIYSLSTNFHRTRMRLRIKKQKKTIQTLIVLLDLSYQYFPFNCPEFSREDTKLTASALVQANSRMANFNHKLQGMKILNNVSRAVNQVSNAVNGIEAVTLSKPPLSRTVKNALASDQGSLMLANRIWKSLVKETSTSLEYEDLLHLLGKNRKEEVLYMFDILDSDGEGGITLEEMEKSLSSISNESKQISKSLVDIDGAITKLHHLLLFMLLILIIIIFVGMLAPSAATVLATLGSTLLALSWMFGTTCAEVFSSCVFVFVKHPYDVGDWVQTYVPGGTGFLRMQVIELSLMYTVFSTVGDGITRQASNSVLNTQFIDNLTRSAPSQVCVTLLLGIPETRMSDVAELERRLNEFINDNPRDYAPTAYVQVSSLDDLDRFTVTVCISLRNNQDDIVQFASRKTKAHAFISRCVNEIPLHVPRRMETSNDPTLPLYTSTVSPEDVNDSKFADAARGKRIPFGLLEDAPVPEEHETGGVKRAGSILSQWSRTSGSQVSVHGLRALRHPRSAMEPTTQVE